MFLVATTSLPAVYRPNGYAGTTTAGTPHARAKNCSNWAMVEMLFDFVRFSKAVYDTIIDL